MRYFSKTWLNDYAWLKLAMKSVLKLSTEAVDWTVVGDRGSRNDIEKIIGQAVQESKSVMRYKIVEVPELWPEAMSISNGYLQQQWIKMNAHMIMGDDLFWSWDSDVIAVRPFSSKNFIGPSGKPIHWFSQFNSLMSGGDRGAHENRIAMMKEVFRMDHISFEWMRCMPIPLFGQILRNGSSRPEWSKSFEMMRVGDHRFSEFNVIGQFSHLFFPDAYEWRNAEASGPTWAGGWDQNGNCFQAHAFVSQGFSWNGIPPHIQQFVDNL